MFRSYAVHQSIEIGCITRWLEFPDERFETLDNIYAAATRANRNTASNTHYRQAFLNLDDLKEHKTEFMPAEAEGITQKIGMAMNRIVAYPKTLLLRDRNTFIHRI